MTSDNAIPRPSDDVLSAPRDSTRLYFRDATAFGRPHARPSTAITASRAWDDGQLLDAAHAGATGCALQPDILTALCARYVDLQTAERQLAAALDEASALVAAAQHQLAQVSIDNLHLRHELSGTTPVSVAIALDRAARAGAGRGSTEPGAELAEQTLRFPAQVDDLFDDTEVADGEYVRASGGWL